jgi:hypothetical protein
MTPTYGMPSEKDYLHDVLGYRRRLDGFCVQPTADVARQRLCIWTKRAIILRMLCNDGVCGEHDPSVLVDR